MSIPLIAINRLLWDLAELIYFFFTSIFRRAFTTSKNWFNPRSLCALLSTSVVLGSVQNKPGRKNNHQVCVRKGIVHVFCDVLTSVIDFMMMKRCHMPTWWRQCYEVAKYYERYFVHCRAVASLTVPGGQKFHFPNFFLKFWSIFPQTLLFSSSFWPSGWALIIK